MYAKLPDFVLGFKLKRTWDGPLKDLLLSLFQVEDSSPCLSLNSVINAPLSIHFLFLLDHSVHVFLADCFEALLRHLWPPHPLVPENVSHCGSRGRFFSQESLDELLKFYRQISCAIFILGPELRGILAGIPCKEIVLIVFDRVWLFPGIVDDLADEERNSKGKTVHVLSLVWNCLVEDFWCHVHWGSQSSVSEAILFAAWESQSVTEVNDFNLVVCG